jgi:hypothetical protein
MSHGQAGLLPALFSGEDFGFGWAFLTRFKVLVSPYPPSHAPGKGPVETDCIGFGMILLNTLTRFHITFILIAAQVIGSIATILARATAPDKVGPGDVFPDFSAGIAAGLAKVDFWLCLLFMLSINALCFMFFRREQLQKP